MPKILMTYHTFSGNTEAAAKAFAEGAEGAGAEVILKRIDEVSIDDLTSADAIAFGTPQPFGFMAGETKKFFERFWGEKERVADKPVTGFICFMTDAKTTSDFMEKIWNYYGFKKAHDIETISAKGTEKAKEICKNLGESFARALK